MWRAKLGWLVLGLLACGTPTVDPDAVTGFDAERSPDSWVIWCDIPGWDPPDADSDASQFDATLADAPIVLGAPTLGEHTLAYNIFGAASTNPLRSTAISVEQGSLVLAMVAKGTAADIAAPTNNQGQTFAPIGSAETYVNWPSSGNALFQLANSTGAATYIVRESMAADLFDECTLSVLEVRGGSQIVDVAVSETASTGPVTSGSVTTTGPALLVAWWWGDSVVAEHTATPDGDFMLVHGLLIEEPIVQTAVAIKQVEAAGTYDVTWTSTPNQGAITYLLAIQ